MKFENIKIGDWLIHKKNFLKGKLLIIEITEKNEVKREIFYERIFPSIRCSPCHGLKHLGKWITLSETNDYMNIIRENINSFELSVQEWKYKNSERKLLEIKSQREIESRDIA